ncbi:ATP-binding protein [Cryptosporangium aurantiacum]|uniref:Signal transduction histidine kinase n=1 Tax=Cryptosporangium aurantiacum TaxID=134849 RepID=A0A1M7MVC8_9ACTN|nr:ATP-binding protein [Cryptosporangium aurantiacum]SHM95092.1 Signal transduction histidine kinase [Cryptosporangium aurantiacum]
MPLTLVSALRGRPEHVPPDFPDDDEDTGTGRTADTQPPSTLLAGKVGLGPVAARSGAVLRLAWCVVAPVVAYGSGPVAAPSYWRDVLVIGALLWGVSAAAVCWRGQLPHWLVLGDVAVSAALLVAAVRLLPTEVAGAAGSWVVGWAGVSILLASWRLRASLVWLVALAEVGAYLIGSRLAGRQTDSTEPFGLAQSIAGTAQAAGVLLALAAIGLVLVRLVRLGAGNAGRTISERNVARREDEVGRARLHDRGVRRLLLHDTVLTTLTAIARGGLEGRADVVRARCTDDLESLAGDPESDDPVRTGKQLVDVVQRQAAYRGLRVYVANGAPDDPLPAAVAAAFAAASREALSNVEKHAGTTEVGVAARGEDGWLELTVHDRGRGFDPATARSDGLGLSKSLTGRMSAVGGSAAVQSAIGRGTVVTLRWSAAEAQQAARAGLIHSVPEAPAPEPAETGPAAPSPAVVDEERILADRYTRYGLLALAWIGHFWQALSLGLLITSWSDYRSGWVAVGGWSVLFVVTFIQVYLVTFAGKRGHPSDWIDRHAWWISALSVAAALVVLLDCTPTGLLTPANWPIGVLGWILAVFAVRRPGLFDLAWLAVALTTLIAVAIAWDGSTTALAVALGVVFGAGIPQVGALVIVFELRRHATAAASALAEQHHLDADREARHAVTTDRAQRDAALNRDLFPLLRALASGSADPDSPIVRRRCELAAAEVRALVDHDDLTTPIATLDAVAAITRSARQRDIVPIVHLGEGLDVVSPGWQRTFTQLADRMLAEALPGEATLTVRGTPEEIAITFCFPTGTPAPQLESVAVGVGNQLVPDRRVRVDIEPDMTRTAWLEVTWDT